MKVNKKCHKSKLWSWFHILQWKKIGKIRMIFDIENSLWKSNFGTFWQGLALRICKKINFHLSSGYYFTIGHLILTTRPWFIQPWITLLWVMLTTINCCLFWPIDLPTSNQLYLFHSPIDLLHTKYISDDRIQGKNKVEKL